MKASEYDKSNKLSKVRSFHRQRRMFCVRDGNLIIADKGLSYSHKEWFHELGWKKDEIEEFMTAGLRGVILPGEIKFYTGYDFRINDQIESDFFNSLPGLAKELNLSPETKIYGGQIVGKPGETWENQKYFGVIKNYN